MGWSIRGLRGLARQFLAGLPSFSPVDQAQAVAIASSQVAFRVDQFAVSKTCRGVLVPTCCRPGVAPSTWGHLESLALCPNGATGFARTCIGGTPAGVVFAGSVAGFDGIGHRCSTCGTLLRKFVVFTKDQERLRWVALVFPGGRVQRRRLALLRHLVFTPRARCSARHAGHPSGGLPPGPKLL